MVEGINNFKGDPKNFLVNSIAYTTKPATDGCKGCSFDTPMNCIRVKRPRCMPQGEAGESVIFVKKT